MYRSLAAIQLSRQLFKSYSRLPRVFFSSQSADESDDDFKPKSKVKDENPEEVLKFIDKIVHENKVMLFMKGTPTAPLCGFSLRVVNILKRLGCDFASANILTSPSVRENLKKYSDWPTFPQLFIKGDFIGGCDIVTDLYKSGELKKLLDDAGALVHPEVAPSTEEKKKP
ncbi:Monothiol glutaredoxin (Grx5) [Blastocystis hominis]|uniref:Monothiol glutaredoxin (Grx5) n=1 Tax=Blastocystis hominis TaxID=12968 RepID=D8M3D1_BLAHO|nr:Monothiol glutaredoxin (Grx5) [Blastocystis hominis]CBK22404.2 Monothiol glutaredoxin (Grx5) [Blastocystis hominis]|eukprot:XP_012896452.1 Monothiol glutaredoxin (Grx5) [Blastocystis hominis]